VLDGQAIDADVTVGRGAVRVPCRLVGIPTPKGPRKNNGTDDYG